MAILVSPLQAETSWPPFVVQAEPAGRGVFPTARVELAPRLGNGRRPGISGWGKQLPFHHEIVSGSLRAVGRQVPSIRFHCLSHGRLDSGAAGWEAGSGVG